MSTKLLKYNPAFLPEDDLVRSFVVRHADLKALLQVIRENDSKSNQHVIVVGPRGAGKTMLVLRTAAEIKRQDDLNRKWYPLVFAEESYVVTTPGEFWLEALFHLARQTSTDRWRLAHDDLRGESDEVRLRERALAHLGDFASEQGKRILLIVENLNMLLGDQLSTDDAWTLRHTLLNEPRIMLLATATQRFDQIQHVGKAMFELFRQHELRPLNDEECRVLWTAVSGRPLPEGSDRPIRIMTGGNPRLVAIVASFEDGRSFKTLMDELTQLVDDHTDYFKSHLDSMAPVERKVYLALAELWKPSTAREVAQCARLDTSKVSSLLNRLNGRSAVDVVSVQGRRKLYQVSERMYNVYYLMRREGSGAGPVRALVNFMTAYYQPEELLELAKSIADEASDLDPEHRKAHYSLYEGLVRSLPDDTDLYEIIGSTTSGFFEDPNLPLSLKGIKDEGVLRQAIKSAPDEALRWVELGSFLHRRSERYDEAEGAYRKAISLDPRCGIAWAQLGLLLHEQLGRYEESEEPYRKALELDPEALGVWGHFGELLHHYLGRYEEAEHAYHRALELEPNVAVGWGLLGQLQYEHLGQYPEAEAACRRSLELDDGTFWIWGCLGEVLHRKLKRYDEAEEAYQRALQLEPEVAGAWMSLGDLLARDPERSEDAGAAYRKAVGINPGLSAGWGRLGELLQWRLGRHQEAEEAYRKVAESEDSNAPIGWFRLACLYEEELGQQERAEGAYRQAITLKPDFAWAWARLGQLLQDHFGRYQEAEAAYRRALDIHGEFPGVWAKLGQLLNESLRRYEEAEAAFHRATELAPADHWAWSRFGALLHKGLHKYSEAEQAYRRAIEAKPDYGWAWAELGQLLHERLQRRDEAEEAYRKAIALDATDAWAHGQLASLLQEDGRLEEAEEAYRQAVVLDPKDRWAWCHLAQFLHHTLRQYDEAGDVYRRIIAMDESDPWAWAHLGQLLHECLHRHEEAEAAYRKALSLQPNWSWVWVLLGNLLDHELSRRDQAEKAYCRAIQLDPYDPNVAKAWWSVILLLVKKVEPARLGDMLPVISEFVEMPSEDRAPMTQVTDMFIELASLGFARESLRILQGSPLARILNPVTVALRCLVAEKVDAAAEVLEVARDIVGQVEQKQEKLAGDHYRGPGISVSQKKCKSSKEAKHQRHHRE